MSSETALTARNGHFKIENQIIARATQWAVNRSLATKSEWGDSDGGGWTNRAAGRRDCTFDSEGKYDTEDEQWDIFVPEDILAAELYMKEALFWYLPRALCLDFKLAVNIDTEEVIGWTSAWGADGKMNAPGEALEGDSDRS